MASPGLTQHVQSGFLLRMSGSDDLQPMRYPADAGLPDIDASRDFGGLHQATDADVRIARTTADVVDALRAARDLPGGLHIRGAGHSMNGQTLPRRGIQLILRFEDEDGDFAIDGEGRVMAPASASWERVVASIERSGRTVPVLTDHFETTVGGTLSASGFGPASLRHGRQVDNVDALEIVLPDGSVSWCGIDEHAEIFGAALAGLGGIGVVRRAWLKTVAYHPYTVTVVRMHGSWEAATAEAQRVANGMSAAPDSMQEFLIGLGRSANGQVADVASSLTFEFDDLHEATAFAKTGVDTQPLVAGLWAFLRVETKANGRLRFRSSINTVLHERWGGHPAEDFVQLWGDFVLPDPSMGERLLEIIERELATPVVQQANFARYGCLIKGVPSTPHIPLSFLSPLGPGASGYHLSQGFYFAVPRDDDKTVFDVKRLLSRARDVAFSLGGRPYLYAWTDLDAEGMASGYGDSWTDYVAVKRSVDPDCVLNRGFFERWGLTP